MAPRLTCIPLQQWQALPQCQHSIAPGSRTHSSAIADAVLAGASEEDADAIAKAKRRDHAFYEEVTEAFTATGPWKPPSPDPFQRRDQ